MPCRSDYLDPTASERETTKVAKLLLYVLRSQGVQSQAVGTLVKDAETTCPDTDRLEGYVQQLCARIRDLSDEERTRVIYNGHSRIARELADWWDDHEESDRRREEDDAQKEASAQLRTQALGKLNIDEMRALGLIAR